MRCDDTPAACGATLQAAIDAVAEGGTLVICPGTYRGGFTINKALTVIGAGDGDRPSRNTILDGNKAQRVLEIPSGTGTVTLQGLLITRGNVADDAGGGIVHWGTRLVMQDSTIAGNRGRSGGGILHGPGMLEMTGCTVRYNVAPNIAGLASTGGGLSIHGPATLTNCLIANNESATAGGGLYVVAAGPVILAGTTVVRDNTATQGGGIFATDVSITIGADCRITGNTADTGSGGGIVANGPRAQVTLDGSTPSPIVVDNCHENCFGDVPNCAPGGTCPA